MDIYLYIFFRTGRDSEPHIFVSSQSTNQIGLISEVLSGETFGWLNRFSVL